MQADSIRFGRWATGTLIFFGALAAPPAPAARSTQRPSVASTGSYAATSIP